MPDTPVVEVPRPTAIATNLKEFREAKAAPAPVAVPQEPPAEKPEAVPASATPSGSVETSTQETGQPPQRRDKSLEGRIKELRAAGKHSEANKLMVDAATRQEKERADRLEEELQTLRTRKPDSPPADPKPPEASATPNGQPKLKDFLAKPENKDREYDDVVEAWEEAKYEWRKNKERAESEGQQRAKTINEKITEGRTKHGADFDAALKVQLHDVNIQALIHRIDNGMDVLMALHQDPAEHARIHALDPVSQLIELGLISRDLKAEAKAAATPPTTEKPQLVPPVSRTSAPPRSLGGLAPGEKSTKTPTTLAEHRANKAAK